MAQVSGTTPAPVALTENTTVPHGNRTGRGNTHAPKQTGMILLMETQK